MLKLCGIPAAKGFVVFFSHSPSFRLYYLTSVDFYFKEIQPYDPRLIFQVTRSGKETSYWNRPMVAGLFSSSSSLHLVLQGLLKNYHYMQCW